MKARNWQRVVPWLIGLAVVAVAGLKWRALAKLVPKPHAVGRWITVLRQPQNLPLLLVSIAVLVVLLLWKLPQWQAARSKGLTDDNRFDRENEARKTLAQILGGVFLLAGLYSSVQTLDLARQGQDLSREGQITDRYTKAIEQLGAVQSASDKDGEPVPRLEVRLGGIYALERIARDSERDRGPIKEVLEAYVRMNSRQKSLRPKDTVRLDIQAVLDVLTQKRGGAPIFDSSQIDLSGADLGGAYLSDAHLQNADLRGADLRGANLSGAFLSGAFFSYALLNGATLEVADLTSASFGAADLSGADLNDAQLGEANLSGANLRGTSLREADLTAAYFTKANLDQTDFGRAILKGAFLNGANLTPARNLTQDQLENTRGDNTTILPPNLTRPAGWSRKK